jgi:N12 class adenine-specific DNA methylase/tRNA1(Val) A37 N6-methylase TrmN6
MAQHKPAPAYLKESPALDLGVFDAYLATEPAQATQPEGGGVMVRMGDAGLSLLKGAIAVPEAAVGLADLVTGGQAGQLAEQAGFRPAEARGFLDTLYSDAQQAANREVQQAQGFLPVMGAALRNPSTIVHGAIESLPLMGGGGVVARGLMKALPGLGMAAAAGAGEGVVTAGSQAEQVRQSTADGLLTPQQAGIAAASGAATGAIGAIAGRLANRLGIGDVDQLVAGGTAGTAGAGKGFVRKVLEGALSEGVLEELPQSVQEQVAVNYALGKPLDEGVDQAAVMGMLSGGLMGGAAGPMGHGATRAGDPLREAKLPEGGPVTRAVNAAVEAEAGRVDLGLPTLTQQQADAAMGAMEAQARADEKSLRAAGRADKSGLPPLPEAPPAQQGSAEVVDTPYLDRVLTLREQMADESVRTAVRSRFGPKAFSDLAYYASAADNLALPERTRENMVAVAERIVADALLQRQPAAPGYPAPGTPVDRLPPAAVVPRIGLDLAPTGRMRVGPDGAARPETRAEAISATQRDQQARQRRTDLGQQVRPAQPAPETPGAAPAPQAALAYGTAPTGRMLAGPQGVRVETQADRINQSQAQAERDAAAQRLVATGLTPDVQRAQALRAQANPQPGDVLNPLGEPFRNEGAAKRAQKKAGGEVLKVRGGWVVRPAAAVAPAPQAAPVPAAAAPIPAAAPAAPAPAAAIEQAAHQAATSPNNDLPQPTEAQREAGNFKMGHVRVGGLDVTVEYPKGSERAGKGADGRPWRRLMRAHYGYIRRTEGADGEPIDVYVGERPEAQHVYVIDQQRADGSFDEHKVMLGYPSLDAAQRGYRAHFPRGWKVGPTRDLSLDEFKTWLKGGDKSLPAAADTQAADQAPVPQTAMQAPAPAPAAASQPTQASPKRDAGGSGQNPPPDLTQETADDPAPSRTPPARRQPLAEGLVPEGVRGIEPGRSAERPSAGDRRADDRGVRVPGGRGARPNDEGGDLGNRRGHGQLPTGADADLGRSVRGLPPDTVRGIDFRPQPGGLTREGSWFDTAARNVELIELALAIDKAGRPATAEEQARLARYVGFGAGEIRNALFPVPNGYDLRQDPDRLIWPHLVREARWKPLAERLEQLPREWQRSILQSTQYAHYTGEGIVRSIWSAVQRLGFTGGKVLEPGSGIGSFAMLMPQSLRREGNFTGVELDGPTALIARLLSPQQHMLHADFIKRQFPRDYFDLAIGNPPFARTKVVADPQYARLGLSLHDYFFAKSIDRVRPGGLMVFVTSHYTMDKHTDRARGYLAERADLLGAIRLPQTAFDASAGTKVVTDVLFLRKRLPGDAPAGPAWGQVQSVETPDGVVAINEYFAAHPHMVLGQNRISGNRDEQGRRISGLRSDGEYTVVSYDQSAADLDAKFAKAVQHLPANVYSLMTGSTRTLREETAKVDFDPQVRREGVVYLGSDGTLMRVNDGLGRPLASAVKLSPRDEQWLRGYVGLRGLVQEARAAQLNDGDWEAALKRLNESYDAFRKQHGPVGEYRTQTRKSTDEDGTEVQTSVRIPKYQRLYREDYDAAIVTQLEQIDESGEIHKAPFLLGRTIGRPVQREIKTVGDALAVSLDELGRLDLDDVARRIHLPREEVVEALGSTLFKTPQGAWQLADEYLSGDVVTKLDEAIEAARLDPALERNVKALKDVQPDKLGPSQIGVKLGASWVPQSVIDAFAREIEAGAVHFDPRTESWQVEGGNLRSQRRAGAEYGTADRSPSELLEAALNSRPVTIKKRVEQKEVTDAQATTAASEAIRKIKDRFKAWVWTDSQRAAELVEVYNRRFNNIAPRRFDGSHLSLPGVSLRYKLHPHQLRAIWRQIQTGDTYLAHAVGAGKTIEMIAGGMEQRRLGLIRKPMYVVPNHMLEQFANEFMELYPLANIMVADDENFSAERRRAFVAAATLNAPDAIIITHSAFERIGVKEESVAPIRDQILTELQIELDDADDGDRVRRSQLEQQIEAVTQRFDRIAGVGAKDSTIKFEDIGADFVYVDEAHAYRKLDFTTNQKIKGIDPGGSKRALDMYVKTRWLQTKRPGVRWCSPPARR